VPIEDFRRLWLSGIYQRYANDVYNVIRFRLRLFGLGDAADDLVQEVFLTAMEKCESLFPHPDIRRWLFATASYKARNYARKRIKEKRRAAQDLKLAGEERIPDPSAEIALEKILDEEIDLEDMIRRVKDGLTEPDRRLYALAYEGKASPASLSEVYGISEAAMRMRISRLRKRVLFAVKNILYCLLQCILTHIL
jgi:RNA polymerase sigma-70 factor (ECF subfamily)